MRIVVLLAINISFHLTSGEYVLRLPQPPSDSRPQNHTKLLTTDPPGNVLRARKELLINPAA